MANRLMIVSGGQTGVDRAALDAAVALGLPCGGWCPRGRIAEDGPIPERYPLQETESDGYAMRTRHNVRDSDGTLILTCGRPAGGTKLTLHYARSMHKPFRVVYLGRKPNVTSIAAWVRGCGILRLNVAGPRESAHPGIHDQACQLLIQVFSALMAQ